MNFSQIEHFPQLTPKGLYSLLEEGKKGILVQVLSSEPIEKPDNKSLRFKVLISDGYAKHAAILLNEAAYTFKASGSPAFSIICIKDSMQQNVQQKRFVVITKIEMIKTDIEEKFGKPIDFQEWLKKDTQQKKSVSKQINVPVYKDVDANSSKSSNRGMIQNNDSFDISFDSNTEITNTPKFITSIDFNDSIAQKSTNKTQIYQRSNSDRGESSKKTSNPNIENITPKSIKKHGSVSFINSDQLVDLNDEFLSVGQLAPFSQFTIKVRVTRKSDLRSFRQGVGEGKVFTVDVIDKEGCETTVTFFGEAADHFYHIMEENTVYIMRGGNVKLNNSKFGKKKNNEYQIVYDSKDAFIKAVENDSDIMLNKFDFVKINKASELEVNSVIDIAAFVKEVGESVEITLKKNNELKQRRLIILYDDSNTLIEMTLWGDLAKNIDVKQNDVIIIKNARINNFGGTKNLTSSFETRIFTKQDQLSKYPIISQLKEWRNKEYNDDHLQSFVSEGPSRKSLLYTIEEINNILPTIREKGNFDLIASIGHIKTEGNSLYYPGCKNKDKCARKAISIGEDNYECTYCKESFQNPIYRYTLQVKISDHTGSIWVHAFDKAGATIVDKDADTLKQMKDMQDESGIANVFKEAHNKEFYFRIYAKRDDYHGENKLKLQAARVEKISYVKQGKEILNLLNQYNPK